jgi:dipeptidyl aminopeptidase/acylaminoacyl peptidase
VDHRRVVDWIETQPDLDPRRIGIFGISMGGIKGALLLPLEKRISAAAIGLAGGDLPYIMAHSTEPGVAKRREKELKERNLTLEECEQKLREILKFDPLRYASYVDPKKVLLVLARYDTVVPIEKGLELKEKMGNPETIMLPSGHYSAALSIPYIKSQAFDFFEKRFTEAQPQKLARQGGELRRVQAGRK